MKGQLSDKEAVSTSKPETSELSDDILRLGNDFKQSVDDLEEDMGVLGRVPPEKKELGKSAEHEGKRRHKLTRKFSSVPDKEGKRNQPEDQDAFVDNNDVPELDENDFHNDLGQDTTDESPTHTATRKENGTSKTHEKYRKNRATNFATRRRMLSGELVYDKEAAEKLLSNIKGHLVLFPPNGLMLSWKITIGSTTQIEFLQWKFMISYYRLIESSCVSLFCLNQPLVAIFPSHG